MKKEKSCGTIVINKNNQVLLVKHNKGHYGFPKGHMEENESEIETAIRETKEETNIDAVINKEKRYEISYSIPPNIDKTVIYFLAYSKNDKIIPQASEIKEVLWIDIDEVSKYLQFTNMIDLWNNKIINDIKKQV